MVETIARVVLLLGLPWVIGCDSSGEFADDADIATSSAELTGAAGGAIVWRFQLDSNNSTSAALTSAINVTCGALAASGDPLQWSMSINGESEAYASFGSIPIAKTNMEYELDKATGEYFYNEVSAFRAACDAAGGQPIVKYGLRGVTVDVIQVGNFNTNIFAKLEGNSWAIAGLSCPCLATSPPATTVPNMPMGASPTSPTSTTTTYGTPLPVAQ